MHTSIMAEKKYVACRTVGLLIVDKGEVEAGINVIKKVLANWIRQITGGIHPDTAEYCEEFNVQTGN
eukprot:11969455-Heterocapsa_arctica.AAC.1